MTELTSAFAYRIHWETRFRVADDLPPAVRTQVLVLASFINRRTGLAGPGVRLLSSITGSKPVTVRKRNRVAHEAGWIFPVRQGGGRGRPTQWALTDPALFTAERGPLGSCSADQTGPVEHQFPEQTGPVEHQFPEQTGPVEHQFPEQTGPVEHQFPTERGPLGDPELKRERSSLSDRQPDITSPTPPLLAALAGGLVDEILGRLPARCQPRFEAERRAMRAAIGDRLRAGWTAAELFECIARVPAAFKAGNPPAFLVHHVPAEPPIDERRPPRPDWCGQCNEFTRMLELDDGSPYHCPSCHPAKIAAAVAR